MLRLATWLRIGGIVALAAAAGSFLAFLAGQEPAEAHDAAPPVNTALEIPVRPADQMPAPVRVVYHAPIVASANPSRPAAPPPASSSGPGKLHIERAPVQTSPALGTRSEKPPLRVGYGAERPSPEGAQALAARARGSGTLDLNRATAEELDTLPGAARISKAIIRGRPYGSPDDLVRKRILTREAFARIREHIAVVP